MKKHMSPITGKPERCVGETCRYGEAIHGESDQEVYAAYEKTMEENSQGAFLNGQRKDTPIEERAVAFSAHSPAMNKAFKTAKVFQKNAQVTMRIAKKGEALITTLKDGTKETSRILSGGEYIVKNPGGEEYAMAEEKFLERYEKGEGDTWSAKGQIKAVQYTGEQAIAVDAPWGEKQYGEPGCYLAESLTAEGERYIIGEKEFAETYRLKQ